MVVLHWTAIPSLENTFKAFEKSKITNSRPEIKSSGALNVSSQFVVENLFYFIQRN
jgi:N-acetylmuramoyl-L-alanine amidase